MGGFQLIGSCPGRVHHGLWIATLTTQDIISNLKQNSWLHTCRANIYNDFRIFHIDTSITVYIFLFDCSITSHHYLALVIISEDEISLKCIEKAFYKMSSK